MNKMLLDLLRLFAPVIAAAILVLSAIPTAGSADDKAETLRGVGAMGADSANQPFLQPPVRQADGHRVWIGEGEPRYPVVVVRGTPYEMGVQLGRMMGGEMRVFLPAAMQGITAELEVSLETLHEVWARSAAFADDRVEQELAGLADGSGVPLELLQAVHAVPLLMPYSCSSIAAWGDATEDGHLYQTRNLDWSLAVKAHEFPVIVVYLPDRGNAHVVPTFAGMIGAHTGLNGRGIALAEMGDAPAREKPYQVHAPHFTVWFRTLLYDADSLSDALDLFRIIHDSVATFARTWDVADGYGHVLANVATTVRHAFHPEP
jgi:isopenicillin-N N-acyltransferase like protein